MALNASISLAWGRDVLRRLGRPSWQACWRASRASRSRPLRSGRHRLRQGRPDPRLHALAPSLRSSTRHRLRPGACTEARPRLRRCSGTGLVTASNFGALDEGRRLPARRRTRPRGLRRCRQRLGAIWGWRAGGHALALAAASAAAWPCRRACAGRAKRLLVAGTTPIARLSGSLVAHHDPRPRPSLT